MPTSPPQHHPFGAKTQQRRATDAERDRGSASARGYGRDWQKLRLVVLARDPLCVFCLARGQLTAARQVDHIHTIFDRPDLRLDPANLRGLCDACHSRHTAATRGRSETQ